KARSVAELRAAGVGVDRVLLVYDGSAGGSDLFQAVLTMLDPQVALTLVPLVPPGAEPHNGHHLVKQDQERAKQLDRELEVGSVDGGPGTKIVDLARDKQYDLIILYLPEDMPSGKALPLPPWADYVLRHAHCQVFVAPAPLIPPEIIDQPKGAAT